MQFRSRLADAANEIRIVFQPLRPEANRFHARLREGFDGLLIGDQAELLRLWQQSAKQPRLLDAANADDGPFR